MLKMSAKQIRLQRGTDNRADFGLWLLLLTAMVAMGLYARSLSNPPVFASPDPSGSISTSYGDAADHSSSARANLETGS